MAGLRELSTDELKQQLVDCQDENWSGERDAGADFLLHELQVHQIELEIQNRELREAQLALELSRDRYAELYDLAPIGYTTLDTEGMILEINLTAANMLGHRREHIVGFPLMHYLAPSSRRRYLHHLHQCRTQWNATSELQLVCGDRLIPVQMVSIAIKDKTDILTFRTALTDIRELKFAYAALKTANDQLEQRVEERTAALEDLNTQLREEITGRQRLENELRGRMAELDNLHHRKDEFLAMLSHELRNPLAPLSTGLETLKLDISAAAAQDVRQMMARQLGQLVRLVDDLLDMSRVQSGKIELQMRREDLRAVVAEVAASIAPQVRRREQTLMLSLCEEPVVLPLDEVRMQQIISNLLNNAIKFTEPGGRIELRLDIERSEAVLRVIDTGCGIAPELLPHVFDLFTQGEHPLDRAHGGLGIGLTLANNLVHMHGGYIQAFSEGQGGGSEFVVRLPLQSGGSAEEVPAAAAEAPVSAHHRILIVDDNEDSARSTATLLARWGHEVQFAFNGTGALDCLELFHPDVVLLDIGLPGMDGYEVAQSIRASHQNEPITLIALTGYGSAEDKERAAAAGFDCHFVKPVDLQALRQWLSH